MDETRDLRDTDRIERLKDAADAAFNAYMATPADLTMGDDPLGEEMRELKAALKALTSARGGTDA